MVSGSRTAVVVRLALERGGQLCPADLAGSGVTPEQLRELARSGVFERVGRGLYLLSGYEMAASDVVGHVARFYGGAVSFSSAAEAYGVHLGVPPVAGPELGHVTIGPARCVRSHFGVVVHRSRHLRPVDRRRQGTVTVTSPARTFVDLAGWSRRLGEEQLIECLDEFLSRRLLAIPPLQQYLAEAPRLPGLGRARRIVATLVGDKVESVAERRLLRLLHGAGLPPGSTQFPLLGEDGRFVARLDVAWPDKRVGLELDGYRYHAGTRTFRYDRERASRIQGEGWTLYRTTPGEIADGAPALLQALHRSLCG